MGAIISILLALVLVPIMIKLVGRLDDVIAAGLRRLFRRR